MRTSLKKKVKKYDDSDNFSGTKIHFTINTLGAAAGLGPDQMQGFQALWDCGGRMVCPEDPRAKFVSPAYISFSSQLIRMQENLSNAKCEASHCDSQSHIGWVNRMAALLGKRMFQEWSERESKSPSCSRTRFRHSLALPPTLSLRCSSPSPLTFCRVLREVHLSK